MSEAFLGKVYLSERFPRVMGILNVSPESFYKGSVYTKKEEIIKASQEMIQNGAEIIDVGAFSTAPYLSTEISKEEEIKRIESALRAITEASKDVVISVDTFRSEVAERALSLGASVINDVTGLKNDEKVAKIVRDHGSSLILMAHEKEVIGDSPIDVVTESLRESIGIALRYGVDEKRIVIDPGIGFFRESGKGQAYSMQRIMEWYRWDAKVIKDMRKLASLGRPICVSVSRKSFIGKILNINQPEGRLTGSIAASVIAYTKGASLFRTHDVLETYQAIKLARFILSS